VHIFFRYDRVLSKEHGAFQDFIIALRDALFILNQEDLNECKDVLKEKWGMSDEAIQKKIENNFDWFLRRVRRLVPVPPDLEKRYLAVYEAFKDIEDSKTGKKLFHSKHAKCAHKSFLKHIRRNCISDIPFLSYYAPIDMDKNGLTLYKCLRGTSALEGLHQKLRQLVRGFSNSPRLVQALVSDYLMRWNLNIEIKIRGLHKRYEGFYDGQMIEEDVENLAEWNIEQPRISDWISTKSFADTGESFGVIDAVATDAMPLRIGDVGSDSDESLRKEAELAADNMHEMGATIDKVCEMFNKMPSSARWMAEQHGRWRPPGRVKTKEEWVYFDDNLLRFQGNAGEEADNHSSFNFSAFADDFNKWVNGLGDSFPLVTYKSASHLQDAFKSKMKRANRESTRRPHVDDLDALQLTHRDEIDQRNYTAEFQETDAPSRPIPPPAATDLETRPITRDTASQTEEDFSEFHDALEMQPPSNKRKRGKSNRATAKDRCRMCGKEWALPQWQSMHLPEDESTSLRKTDGFMPHMHCNVPVHQRETGFPVLNMSKPMPRRPRLRKNKRGQEIL